MIFMDLPDFVIFCNFLVFGDREKCLSNLEMGDQSDYNDIKRFDGL